jgi:hypothetical protein
MNKTEAIFLSVILFTFGTVLGVIFSQSRSMQLERLEREEEGAEARLSSHEDVCKSILRKVEDMETRLEYMLKHPKSITWHGAAVEASQ